jgi:ATP-dependent DNA helicase RecG
MKQWEPRALELLNKSFSGVRQELNELDWKVALSPNREKLSQHLSAFANYPGGGFLIFGIDNKTCQPVGIATAACKEIISTLSTIASTTLNPLVTIEHADIIYEGYSLLMIFIHESRKKPVYIKNGTIENSYVRSDSTTHKASPAELAELLLNG